MSFTVLTSGAAIRRAGLNANSTIVISGAAITDYCDAAEDFISTYMRYDVVTNWANLTSNGKKIITETAACLAAQDLVNYNPSGYYAGEATTILNKLENTITRNLKYLEDDKYKKYLGAQ